MTVAAQAAPQPARPRTWADVGLAALIVVFTPILRLGGMDIRSALFWATCVIVVVAWAITLPHYLVKVGKLSRLIAHLAQQQTMLDRQLRDGDRTDEENDDPPRIGRRPR
ncbi:hypothetical protein [Amycolatopsis kentuckyensis]|uniref:hypothetical protein n=1 Tax=Amycolatopsis kentuckyensis TaxID=218823 RepID=UPI000A3C8F6C|nr:hypothetical protein [Amycolatopsis kentuckyensis]